MWLAVLVVSLALWRENSDPAHQIPIWLWQVAMVGSGLVLASRPLLDEVRRRSRQPQPLLSETSVPAAVH